MTNKQRIEELEAVVKSLRESLSSLEADVDENNTNIYDLNLNLEDYNEMVDDLVVDVEDINRSTITIEDLDQLVEKSEFDVLSDTVEENTADIDMADNRLLKLEKRKWYELWK